MTGRTAALALFAALGTVDAAQAADLTGIWQVVTPVVQLKADGDVAPPLKPAAARLYRQRIAMKAKGDLGYDPTQMCKPPGEPRIRYQGMPFEIIQTPTQIIFNYQWNRLNHIIYFDTPKGLGVPMYFGSGPATWEGDTLRIDSQMIHGETLLDEAGMPHSESLKLTERFTLAPDGRTLTETIGFDDPETFTRPWATTIRYAKQDAERLDEDVCVERMKLYP